MTDKNLLEGFSSLREYTEFLGTLVEKKADGQEIARGKDKHDKSKASKKKEQVVTKEVKKNANGSATETHYDHIDPDVEEPEDEMPQDEAPPPEAPPPEPMPPGSQVVIGNKPKGSIRGDRSIKLEVGETDNINIKPSFDPSITKNIR